MILHVVGRKGGGYGTFLELIQKRGEPVWEVYIQKNPPVSLNDISYMVVHSFLPDLDITRFPGRKAYYLHGLRGISRRQLQGRRELNPLRLYRFRRFSRWLSKFDIHISVSFSIRFRAKQLYGIDSLVIYNGIDELPEREVSDEGYILWIGRDAWIKGLDRFLELMKLLPRRKGIIVGRIEGKWKLPRNVEYLGFSEDPYELIAKANTVVITSYYESFSYVTLEALYYNKRVLVLRSAEGAWEILQVLGLHSWGFEDIYSMASYIESKPSESVFTRRKVIESFSFERTYTYLKNVLSS